MLAVVEVPDEVVPDELELPEDPDDPEEPLLHMPLPVVAAVVEPLPVVVVRGAAVPVATVDSVWAMSCESRL